MLVLFSGSNQASLRGDHAFGRNYFQPEVHFLAESMSDEVPPGDRKSSFGIEVQPFAPAYQDFPDVWEFQT